MSFKTVLVVISASTEWQVVTDYYPDRKLQESIFNQWFDRQIKDTRVIFYHGGWGKISAAAATQYAIDRWMPDAVINFGTCGGVEGCIKVGDVVLASETLVYDIYERMGDAQAAVEYYTTRIDLSWLNAPTSIEVKKGRLISADQDINPDKIKPVMEQYQACAADWESGAIAWVAGRNRLRCLILRGVTDLVDDGGGEAYGNFGLFKERTKGIMVRLLDSLPDWLDLLK